MEERERPKCLFAEHGDAAHSLLDADGRELYEEVLAAARQGHLVRTDYGQDGSEARVSEYVSPLVDPPQARYLIEVNLHEQDSELWEASTWEAAWRLSEELTNGELPDSAQPEPDDHGYEEETGAPEEEVADLDGTVY